MSKVKTEDKATDKPASPSTEQQPPREAPHKAGGPLRAAGKEGPPDELANGGARAARAAGVLASPEKKHGAASRARLTRSMQRAVGNSRLSRMLGSAPEQGGATQDQLVGRNSNGGFQMMSVSRPDSPSEREAEAVAQRVATGHKAPPITPASLNQVHPVVQPEGKKGEKNEETAPTAAAGHQEKEEEHTHLAQREATGPATEAVDTSAASNAVGRKGAGSPVNPGVRRTLEPRMGADLGAARVHSDGDANEAASSINARAFTHGSDIFLARGESEHDTHLMAHELTHVIQQRETKRSPLLQRQVEPHDTSDSKSSPVKEQNKQGKLDDDGGKAETGKALGDAAEETKSITLSRGILQMTSEGDFTESDTSVKRPHFPFNVNVFQKLTDAEIKTYDDAKTGHDEEKKKDPKKGAFKKPYQRYAAPDANGVFKEDDAGSYKMGERKDRHSTTTYTATLGTDQQMGTTNNSGVTIGFGIDLGNRYSTSAEAKKDFQAAGLIDDKGSGVDGNKADKLLDAVGLKGIRAAEKAANLRSDGVALTVDQVLKLLNVVIPSYDRTAYTKGYSRGDGTLDPAIEEVLMALSYWGGKPNALVRAAIIKEAKGKKGAEQFRAAAKAVKDTKSNADWMQRGYQIYISYLETLAEMKDSGYEINMSDSVSDKDTLTGTKKDVNDATLQFVKDLSERVGDYKTAGKDLKKQMSGTGLASLITGKVGESKDAKNTEVDVKVIQQLLYNGNYDVEVTGKYDDKTKTAIQKFTKDEFGTSSDTIDPGGQALRHMKKFQYLKRST